MLKHKTITFVAHTRGECRYIPFISGHLKLHNYDEKPEITQRAVQESSVERICTFTFLFSDSDLISALAGCKLSRTCRMFPLSSESLLVSQV